MPADSPHHLAGRRILVVEDDWILAEDLREELVSHGALILGPARTVGEAMGLLGRERRPDIAVLDVRLGTEKVFPIAQVLREHSIPFVFESGGEWFEMPREFADEIFFQKPLDLESLLPLLAHL